ncbi:MAG: phosphate acyltransferase PlsX [Akkermansia sp.]|nr:phosphate acyltransferase PlsX [Akkermansia sp.]
MKLALDAMGGDFAPQINIDGAKMALAEIPSLEKLYLVGREEELKAACKEAGILDDARVEIVHAPEVVEMEDSGLDALRKKRNSSMSVAVDLVKNGTCDAVLSAGNTGAAVAASTIKLRLLPGVERAGIVSPLPSVHGYVLVSDTGANPDAKPRHLVAYAVMSALMARYIYERPTPNVGVMSNGTEDCKGSEFSKEVHRILRSLADADVLPFNFTGNCEGHDLFETELDVAVTDGFTGNVLLKSVEATAKAFAHWLKAGIKASPMAMLGAMGMRGVFKKIGKQMSADTIGGCPLMGVRGVSIIAHGSANGTAILNAIRMADGMCRNNVNDRIVAAMERINEEMKKIAPAAE